MQVAIPGRKKPAPRSPEPSPAPPPKFPEKGSSFFFAIAPSGTEVCRSLCSMPEAAIASSFGASKTEKLKAGNLALCSFLKVLGWSNSA